MAKDMTIYHGVKPFLLKRVLVIGHTRFDTWRMLIESNKQLPLLIYLKDNPHFRKNGVYIRQHIQSNFGKNSLLPRSQLIASFHPIQLVFALAIHQSSIPKFTVASEIVN